MKRVKKARILIAIAVFLIASIAVVGVTFYFRVDNFYKDNYVDAKLTTFDYTETNQKLYNPFTGFYGLRQYLLSEEMTEADLSERLLKDCKEVKNNPYWDQLVVEINLSNYASQALTHNAIMQTNQILKFWDDMGYSLILRFLYDWEGQASLYEPERIDIVESHMDYLKDTINVNYANILTLQGVYVGNYGEMHGGSYMDNESMTRLMKYQAERIKPDIYLSVRTPSHRRIILDSSEDLQDYDAYTGSLAARIGLYDDGLMSSESDLGTFGESSFSSLKNDITLRLNREEEIDYQDRLCGYVPNGGEIPYDTEYNDVTTAIKTLTKMHMTYLNAGGATKKWKSKKVKTKDLFKGMSAYDYIEYHTGYRFHFSSVESDFDCYKDDNYRIRVGVTNTGFAPPYRQTTLCASVINNDTKEQVYYVWIDDLDVRSLAKDEEGKCTIIIPRDKLEKGNYSVYIRPIFNIREKDIYFANSLERDEKRGYKVAEFSWDNEVPDISFKEKVDIYNEQMTLAIERMKEA